MLVLKNIGKDYPSSHGSIHALRCVNLVCRPRELVMILGSNGSGKTALLEVIAGQQPASRGDLLINGESTRKFSDKQWSSYRRRVMLADEKLLLPGSTVMENAVMSLRLLGQRSSVARAQAKDMLTLFGLDAYAERYPGELSAAQRKLAALCCAMAAEPDVLLVDEPVLGLDSATAKKVAGILWESAKHCLVITASRKAIFSEENVRTVRMKDGTVESDSASCTDANGTENPNDKLPGLGVGGVLSMAVSGFRRGGSRFLVGAAAVFCAALVLIASQAMVSRSAQVQENTLSAYPIVITENNASSQEMEELYQWLLTRGNLPAGTEIQPNYEAQPWIFMAGSDGSARQVNPTEQGTSLWAELPEAPASRMASYQLINGRWPERYDEVALIQHSDGSYSSAGLRSIGVIQDGGADDAQIPGFDSFLHTTFRLVLPTQSYYPNADGTWGSLREDPSYMAALLTRVPSLKIVGILRSTADNSAQETSLFIGYTRAMTDYIQNTVSNSDIVKAQQSNPSVDVLTGLPFDTQGLRAQSAPEKAEAMLAHISTLDAAALRTVYRQAVGQDAAEQDMLQSLQDTLMALPVEETAALYDSCVLSAYSTGTYDGNMKLFGLEQVSKMTELRLLSTSLKGRQELSSLLDAYSTELSYSDPSEIMVAAAGQYASGLERLRIFFSAAAVLCAVIGIFAVYSAAVKNRRLHWNRLRGRGMSRRKIQNVCLWESAVLSVPSAVVGIGAAWLLTGPVCRWMGWSQLAAHCVPALWLMVALALLTVLAAVLAAVIAAISVTGVWPGDVLYKGKE